MAKCQVLLLGGIGSGKSSVGRLLADRGAAVFDADAVGHQVLETNEIRQEVEAHWPSALRDGRVDRRRLASIVFADHSELQRLESITQPRIKTRLAELVAASESNVVVVETPILRDLIEGEWLRVVVDVPDTIRLNRLAARGMDENDARARMSSQPSRRQFVEVADFVIDNSGEQNDLRSQADALFSALAQSCGYPVSNSIP